MRILLDTNILIHREANAISQTNVGLLFKWLNRLKYDLRYHVESKKEIEKHKDERLRGVFLQKLSSYQEITYSAPLADDVNALCSKFDSNPNDSIDTILVNELYHGTVDYLISEDKGIARKAESLGLGHKVFSIESFIEKLTAENPALANYGVLAVKKVKFGDVNLQSNFFDSFRKDYPEFDRWFLRKADEEAYVCKQEGKNANGTIDHTVAFLYLKIENANEIYHDISPPFKPSKRLKIGTMKVELNGYKIGERFLKIIFDNAILANVEEIYVTIYENTDGQKRLVNLLEEFGFERYGFKNHGTSEAPEVVLVKSMRRAFDSRNPKMSFPFVGTSSSVFMVPIYPKYHTDLLPDSILRNESRSEFVDHAPHRNAIRKVYVSNSIERMINTGDILVFYRTGGRYKSVVTTLGIVDQVHLSIKNKDHFISLCRKRSVFTDEELGKQWDWKRQPPPFIVEFLYVYSFPKRPNLDDLINNRVIRDTDSAPRGFHKITLDQFETILRLSKSDLRIVVN